MKNKSNFAKKHANYHRKDELEEGGGEINYYNALFS